MIRSNIKTKTQISSSILVDEFVRVSIHPVLWREGYVVEMSTVIPAFTRLDEHGRPLEALAIWANKGHGYCARTARRAATSIRTHTAVVGSVETDTQAFAVGQADGFWSFVGWGTLSPFLVWMIKAKRRVSHLG